MKIVVTGSKGFLGSLLVKRLEEKGHHVIGLDQPKYDIRAWDIEYEIPTDTDVLIHLASISTDKACKLDPHTCFDVNVLGTLRLIEASKKRGVKQFIFASTEWVYGESDKERVEEDSINATTLGEYALSKYISEINLLQNFMMTNIITTVFRFGIIYGPREKNWSVVESLFNDLRNKDEIRVGSLRTGRNYIHVEDVVSGIIASLGIKVSYIFNLTGNEFVTLEDIIRTSAQIINKEGYQITESSPTPSIRKVNNFKARFIMNWEPKYDLKKGLETLL